MNQLDEGRGDTRHCRPPSWAPALALLLFAACHAREATVIDGTSPESFERSAKQARREIPDADRLVFDRALRTVGGRRHSIRDTDALARVTFDGMTAEQIVADQKLRDRG
jgi:hypothetical protein